MTTVPVLLVATIVVAVQRFMTRPMTAAEQQRVIQDTPQPEVSSLEFTTPREALAAVNATLNIMVEVKTTDMIDRIKYSINGTVVATLKEPSYNIVRSSLRYS